MQTKRVVITGIGGITAFGNSWAEIKNAFQRKQNAVQAKADWLARYPELEARLGAEILNYQPPKHWNRKQLRSLGRVSQFAVDASERALANAGLLDENGTILTYLKDGRMGVACGSSTGSTHDIKDPAELLMTGK